MKKSLLKVLAVGLLIGVSQNIIAQTDNSEKVYRYEVWEGEGKSEADRRIVAVYIFDSYNDFLKFKEYQSKDGWLYGMGEATGNPNRKKAILIKREAQDAAYDQIAGQLFRIVQRIHWDYNHEGHSDELNLDDLDWEDGFYSYISGVLPQASMQFAYKIEKTPEMVTYVVGVGIDMKKAQELAEKAKEKAIQAAIDEQLRNNGMYDSKKREEMKKDKRDFHNGK